MERRPDEVGGAHRGDTPLSVLPSDSRRRILFDFGATVFRLMQDFLSQITPQYWTFWLGLFLVVLVLVGRDRLLKPWTWWRRA